jgi:hypothetical protein
MKRQRQIEVPRVGNPRLRSAQRPGDARSKWSLFLFFCSFFCPLDSEHLAASEFTSWLFCARGLLIMMLSALLGILASVAQADDLKYALGQRGLSALSYRGTSLLANTDSGALQVVHETPTATRLDAGSRTLTQTYSWGRVACVYGAHADRLFLRLTVVNQSSGTLDKLALQVAELRFPMVPTGDTVDPGQSGTGGPHPLSDYPLTADPKNSPAALLIDDGANGVLDFCGEIAGDSAALSVPFTTNPPAKTQYPFWVTLGPIRPHASQTCIVSLRFAPPGTSPTALAADVYRRYAAVSPFRLVWKDRRPIGTNFLATSEAHPAKNPRGWFLNDKDIDVTTPEGMLALRKRVLAYAEGSVKVLKAMNAQGMVTWDPEGQEYGPQTYYGDPRLVSHLAPEMEYKDASGVATIDAYFQTFRRAGLRVGVCLRPQQIAFVNGAPVQQEAEDAAQTLLAKLAYARKRWGCTLFYVDSTVDAHGIALSSDVFQIVTKANPNVLLMPENQTTRDYAYTAPFDSFFHHGALGTPAGVRAVYPGAFTALYATGDGPRGTLEANHDKLVAAVRHGDILLFHCWYDAPENAKIKRIYQDAAAKR